MIDIEKKADEIEREIERYIRSEVRPHLQKLLDKAQRRMRRHALYFSQGMGTYCLCVDDDVAHPLADAVELLSWCEVVKDRRKLLYAARFPELVEFMAAVQLCLERLNGEVGDMEPGR